MTETAHSTPKEGLGSTLRGLREDPLWHASLGSKELFHSNVLAWMIDSFPARARTIFAPWLRTEEGATENRVRREYRHLDLVIEFVGFSPLVVENKMFALPDDAQLDRYATETIPRLPGQRPSLVLLSLVDPGWPNDELRCGKHVWAWVSYRQLAERIRDEFPTGRGEFPEELLAHYAQLLLLIQTVVDQVHIQGPSDPLWLSPQLQRSLDGMRLGELAAKVRAHEARRHILRALADRGLTAVAISVGFTNGSPLIESFRRLPDGNEAGWQYQQGQWRLAMILPTMAGRSPADRKRRERHAAVHARWFDFGPFSKITGGPETPPPRAAESTGRFNRYDPDFVYRYRLLPNPSVAQITDLALAYSQLALEFRLGE